MKIWPSKTASNIWLNKKCYIERNKKSSRCQKICGINAWGNISSVNSTWFYGSTEEYLTSPSMFVKWISSIATISLQWKRHLCSAVNSVPMRQPFVIYAFHIRKNTEQYFFPKSLHFIVDVSGWLFWIHPFVTLQIILRNLISCENLSQKDIFHIWQEVKCRLWDAVQCFALKIQMEAILTLSECFPYFIYSLPLSNTWHHVY